MKKLENDFLVQNTQMKAQHFHTNCPVKAKANVNL